MEAVQLLLIQIMVEPIILLQLITAAAVVLIIQ
jgi:hypothetical protein